jgi:hypothetical protein
VPLKSTPCAGRVLGPGDTACVHHSSMEGAPRRIAVSSVPWKDRSHHSHAASCSLHTCNLTCMTSTILFMGLVNTLYPTRTPHTSGPTPQRQTLSTLHGRAPCCSVPSVVYGCIYFKYIVSMVSGWGSPQSRTHTCIRGCVYTCCTWRGTLAHTLSRWQMVSRSEDGSAESADGAEAEAEATGNGVRTCLGCRRAKVKCDMATPCSRCTRLSVECVPTPPSRRGRAGERKVKRKRQAIGVQTEDFQGISKMAKYELMIVDTCADGLEPAKEGE